MEQPNQEVRLGVAQPVATAVLHKFELGIDALADRGRCRLGKYNPCECLPYIEGTGLEGTHLIRDRVRGDTFEIHFWRN